MKAAFIRFLGLYLALLVCFILSVVGIQLIPRDAIEENVLSSSKLLQEEGDYPYKYLDRPIFHLDNYTDALMLNMAVSADSSHPLDASLMCYYYGATAWSEGVNLEKSATRHLDYLEHNIYGRYWQGHQVFLRPLLCFFTLNSIRHISFVLIWSMVAICLFLVGRKIGWIESLLLLVSLFGVNLFVVPYSLQYSNCFYQMLLYTIVLLLCPKLTNSLCRLALTFFAIGGLTEFFDFLTTPQITLGIPLVLVLLAYKSEPPLCRVFVASFGWLMGYAMLWGSKWIVGYAITGYNFLSNATAAVQERISTSIGDTEITFRYIFSVKLSSFEIYAGLFLLLVMLGIVVWALRQPDGRLRLQTSSWLLWVALIVPVWYAVLLNHTMEHFWFTRRAMLVTLFSVLIWGKRVLCFRR